MQNIREQLASELYEQKMSYEKLAEESGVHRNTCYRFINYEVRTSMDIVAAIADALGFELTLRRKTDG